MRATDYYYKQLSNNAATKVVDGVVLNHIEIRSDVTSAKGADGTAEESCIGLLLGSALTIVNKAKKDCVKIYLKRGQTAIVLEKNSRDTNIVSDKDFLPLMMSLAVYAEQQDIIESANYMIKEMNIDYEIKV